MPTSYLDQFYAFDPAFPPPAGTPISVVKLTLIDENDDGDVDRFNSDSVNGSDITASYPGDTVTINVPGVGNVTYTGITFYLANGQRVFTPTDGQVLEAGTLVGTTFVQGQGPLLVPDQLGPPCFTAGTLIATPLGPRPVETLAEGDAVLTRDNGVQRLVWTGAREVEGTGRHAPVRLAAGALGNTRDLVVSPQHRMVVRGWRAELFAGHSEVLVAAVHLVNGTSITRSPVDRVAYHHIMCGGHEVVFAEGAETETLDPVGELARGEREILARLPARPTIAATVLPALRGYEARLLAL